MSVSTYPDPNNAPSLDDWELSMSCQKKHPEILSENRRKKITAEREFNKAEEEGAVRIWCGKAYFNRVRFPIWWEKYCRGEYR